MMMSPQSYEAQDVPTEGALRHRVLPRLSRLGLLIKYAEARLKKSNAAPGFLDSSEKPADEQASNEPALNICATARDLGGYDGTG
jgi:hypothetical protein